MDNLLKAKHWQLFIFIFGIPFLTPFFMVGPIIKDVVDMQEPDVTAIFSNFMYFPIIMLIYIAVMFGWYWSVGVGLQKKVPEDVTLKVNRFKIFFFFPLIYMMLFILIFFWIFSSIDSYIDVEGDPEEILRFAGMFLLILPLHFFAIFCTFYMYFFCAKTIKTVQLQREVVFGDFVAEFFLIWFFPIGVWILQPEINKMVD